MNSEEQTLLKAKCQHCRRLFEFRASDYRLTAPCPFCKEPTLLREESSPAAAPDTKKLPQWVFPAIAVLSLTVIVGVVLYKLFRYAVGGNPYAGLGIQTPDPFLILFLVYFMGFVTWVVWVCFLVYVFLSLKEMRAVLKQVEANTRTPRIHPSKPPEQVSATAPTLSKAPEDAKYMPKI